MEWEFSGEQVIDGELTFSLTEFTNKLFEMIKPEVASVMGSFIPEPPAERSAEPMDDFYVQYYICFYNYMLCLATDRSMWAFRSHTKKMTIAPEIRAKFLDKKFLVAMGQEQVETVEMFMAVLKKFVSDLIESGISSARLPQMIYMQQLNSFSSILPSIMKNEKARNMLIKIEFHDSFFGSVKKIIRLLPIGG